MRRVIFILLFPSLAWATCPQFTYPENHKLDQELNNVCNNIRNPVISKATIQTAAISSATISSATLLGQLNMTSNKIINLANGTNSNDAINLSEVAGTRVVQIVSFTLSTASSTTKNSFIDTGLDVTITPLAVTDKIIIVAMGLLGNASPISTQGLATLYRGTTILSNGNGFCDQAGNGTVDQEGTCTMFFVDSPNTTSATTYGVRIANLDNATTVRWNSQLQSSIIYALDIN